MNITCLALLYIQAYFYTLQLYKEDLTQAFKYNPFLLKEPFILLEFMRVRHN